MQIRKPLLKHTLITKKSMPRVTIQTRRERKKMKRKTTMKTIPGFKPLKKKTAISTSKMIFPSSMKSFARK